MRPTAKVQNANPGARNGRLAQLVRASVLHTEGRRFESSTAHQLRQVEAANGGAAL